MIDSADALWQLNTEYTQRLARARSSLELVGRLLAQHVGEPASYDDPDVSAAVKQLFAVLDYCNDRLNLITNEHRDWRYRYFYESPDSRRVVQEDAAIRQALIRFSKMRTHHERMLRELAMLIDAVPRPNPTITRVPNADMWEMMRAAIAQLLDFSGFMAALSPP